MVSWDPSINLAIDEQPEAREAAFAAFCAAYPAYETTAELDELRHREYSRLDAQNQTYLDYTGGGLYADSQLRDHIALLQNSLPDSF
jgi:hypothetical protein